MEKNLKGCNDTQYNNIQLNSTQHNDIQYNDTQHNDIQHSDTQHNNTHLFKTLGIKDTRHLMCLC